MFRHIVEARNILIEHKFNKLMFKEKPGITYTLEKLITEYNLERLIKSIPLTLDSDLLNKLAILKTSLLDSGGYSYTRTLLNSCEVLEEKYRESIQGTHKTLLLRLYDTTIKHNTGRRCPYRWFEMKVTQPCMNAEKASKTLEELNMFYNQSIRIDFSDDCTNNAYELLDYIKQIPLQLQWQPQWQPQLQPQQQQPLDNLAAFVQSLASVTAIAKNTTVYTGIEYKQKELANLVKWFNRLTPYDAYTLNTKNPNYRFPPGTYPDLKGVYNLDTIWININKVNNNMRERNPAQKWIATNENGRMFLDFNAFYQKINARGGTRKRRRKSRPNY